MLKEDMYRGGHMMGHVRNTVIVLFSFLLLSCEKTVPEDISYISVEDPNERADRASRKVRLPENLEEAGNNPNKIAQVYRDAVELGDSNVQTLADKKLYTIIIPRAEAASWEGTFRKLRKNAPEGSESRKRLEEIFQTLKSRHRP